ncbi:hypothetical protein [Rhinolophus gammaherpesvirus 1]|uniref:Uncharacterized protein n=1 Tax=Rhinolophus gammaherpesvirus 1 TaxID=2054179 RepID=A0A2Z5U672_9GAMA|nr:hypothetical protein [Rhinolophus gammaherpesvirus 1]BBB06529.1 hypothetical protein [Rhinolophus gammaherpesvirus 1]
MKLLLLLGLCGVVLVQLIQGQITNTPQTTNSTNPDGDSTDATLNNSSTVSAPRQVPVLYYLSPQWRLPLLLTGIFLALLTVLCVLWFFYLCLRFVVCPPCDGEDPQAEEEEEGEHSETTLESGLGESQEGSEAEDAV